MILKNSGFIAYVDESGDYLINEDISEYPIFVLAYCIFKIEDYLKFSNKFIEFKFKHYGHDMAIFHENDMNRYEGAFKFLKGNPFEGDFYEELASIIDDHDFKIIASAINKQSINNKNFNQTAISNISLRHCLDTFQKYLTSLGLNNRSTHVIIESKGHDEDLVVERSFREYCNKNAYNIQYNFIPKIVSKKTNSSGLQLVDLIARPIGLSVIRPDQENRSHEIIEKKYLRDKAGNYLGVGLSIIS